MTGIQRHFSAQTSFLRRLCILLILSALLVLMGCTAKKQQSFSNEAASAERSAEAELPYTPPPELSDAEKYGAAAVVLGPGYNDPEFSSSVFSYLSSVFGFVSEGGLVYPIVYPGMLTSPGTKRPNMKNLIPMLADKKINVLIFVGAPENTHYTITELRKKGIEYPVFSLFTQDDTAATEWSCDIVLDTVTSFHRKFESAEREETGISTRDDAAYLTETVIKSIPAYHRAKEEGLSAAFFVQEAFGHRYTVNPYNDLETGLRSLNHFLLEQYTSRNSSNE